MYKIAKGPCWIVEVKQDNEIIRRTFKTHDEVIAYQTDKPMGVRSWNVVDGEQEGYQSVEKVCQEKQEAK